MVSKEPGDCSTCNFRGKNDYPCDMCTDGKYHTPVVFTGPEVKYFVPEEEMTKEDLTKAFACPDDQGRKIGGIIMSKLNKFIGQSVIVRGDRSGVFFGEMVSRIGSEVELKNARKLFRWDGAGAVEQIALDGVSKPNGCKFTVIVEKLEILDAIQIIECTEKAIKSIDGVPVWKY